MSKSRQTKPASSYQLPPARTNGDRTKANVRCPQCNKLLAELISAPYRIKCPRCGSMLAQGASMD